LKNTLWNKKGQTLKLASVQNLEFYNHLSNALPLRH